METLCRLSYWGEPRKQYTAATPRRNRLPRGRAASHRDRDRRGPHKLATAATMAPVTRVMSSGEMTYGGIV
jgi:hypothetical protein